MKQTYKSINYRFNNIGNAYLLSISLILTCQYAYKYNTIPDFYSVIRFELQFYK